MFFFFLNPEYLFDDRFAAKWFSPTEFNYIAGFFLLFFANILSSWYSLFLFCFIFSGSNLYSNFYSVFCFNCSNGGSMFSWFSLYRSFGLSKSKDFLHFGQKWFEFFIIHCLRQSVWNACWQGRIVADFMSLKQIIQVGSCKFYISSEEICFKFFIVCVSFWIFI